MVLATNITEMVFVFARTTCILPIVRRCPTFLPPLLLLSFLFFFSLLLWKHREHLFRVQSEKQLWQLVVQKAAICTCYIHIRVYSTKLVLKAGREHTNLSKVHVICSFPLSLSPRIFCRAIIRNSKYAHLPLTLVLFFSRFINTRTPGISQILVERHFDRVRFSSFYTSSFLSFFLFFFLLTLLNTS